MNTLRIVAEQKKRIFPNGEIPHPILAVNVRHSDKKGARCSCRCRRNE